MVSDKIIQLVNVEQANLKSKLSDKEYQDLKNDVDLLSSSEFAVKWAPAFGDIAQALLLCEKLDSMLHATLNTARYAMRWKRCLKQ